MKKTMILAGAALLALVACNKSQTVITEEPQGIGIKAISTPATKAITNPEWDGTTFPTDNKLFRMYVSATSKDANGTVTKGDYMDGQHFSYIVSTYKPSALGDPATETPIYWPLGGSTLDFLALAWYKVGNDSESGNIVLDPTGFTWGTTNRADEVTVSNVNLTENKLDLMYAAANNQKGTATGASGDDHKVAETTLAFKHAGAVVEVKACANVASKIKIQNIYFATLKQEASTFALNTYDTLDKTGTFKVDNQYNTLQASWSLVEQPTFTFAAGTPVEYALDATPMTLAAAPAAQVGDDMIIIPQPKTDFVIKYQIDGNATDYYITANVQKGNWLMGHKYIYNITMNIYQIEVGANVVAYVSETDEDISI